MSPKKSDYLKTMTKSDQKTLPVAVRGEIQDKRPQEDCGTDRDVVVKGGCSIAFLSILGVFPYGFV